jgi:hypothetical protein
MSIEGGSGQGDMSDNIGIAVRRGQESWNYIYVAFGFALAIEATVITMVEPLKFPWNIATWVGVLLGTGYLFLFNGWFQNKLMGWKAHYEGRFH